MPIPAPVVVPHDMSLLFLAEEWVSAENGSKTMTVTLYRTNGTLAEAEVTDRDGKLLLKERIDMRAMITTWFTDLLNRAEKGERSS
jgi:hypothetical protein